MRLGPLPEDWQEIAIGSVAQINPPRPNLRDVSDETTVMFVPMAALDDVSGQITAPETRALGDVREKSYRAFTSGDVLFAKITPCMENGKTAVVPNISTGLGFGSTEFHVLRPGLSVKGSYLWYYLRQEAYRKEAEHNMTGSVGQARVPKEFVERSVIPLPPLAVQGEIVNTLDWTTAKTRSAVSHLVAARHAIGRFREAVLAAASSGRLTTEWRDVHPDELGAHVLRDIADQRKGNTRAAVPTEIPQPQDDLDYPTSWRWTNFGSLISELKNGVSQAPEMEPPGIPILRISSTRALHVDVKDRRYLRVAIQNPEQFALRQGDLLFTRYNGSLSLLGVCGMVRGISDELLLYPDKLMRARFDHELVLPEWAELYFASPQARERMTASGVSSAGQQGISGASVKAQPFPVPPVGEQREIVRRANEMLLASDRLASGIAKAATQVERSAESVFAKAFRGELRVSSGRAI